MAICGNCGAQSSRVRSRWTEKGVQLPDQCPSCAPESMHDPFKSVRDGQIAMGWEYMPQMYRKTDNGYVAKDELLADTEAQATKQSDEDIAAENAALAKKRAMRRTKPLSSAEIEIAITRWNNAAQA